SPADPPAGATGPPGSASAPHSPPWTPIPRAPPAPSLEVTSTYRPRNPAESRYLGPVRGRNFCLSVDATSFGAGVHLAPPLCTVALPGMPLPARGLPQLSCGPPQSPPLTVLPSRSACLPWRVIPWRRRPRSSRRIGPHRPRTGDASPPQGNGARRGLTTTRGAGARTASGGRRRSAAATGGCGGRGRGRGRGAGVWTARGRPWASGGSAASWADAGRRVVRGTWSRRSALQSVVDCAAWTVALVGAWSIVEVETVPWWRRAALVALACVLQVLV